MPLKWNLKTSILSREGKTEITRFLNMGGIKSLLAKIKIDSNQGKTKQERACAKLLSNSELLELNWDTSINSVFSSSIFLNNIEHKIFISRTGSSAGTVCVKKIKGSSAKTKIWGDIEDVEQFEGYLDQEIKSKSNSNTNQAEMAEAPVTPAPVTTSYLRYTSDAFNYNSTKSQGGLNHSKITLSSNRTATSLSVMPTALAHAVKAIESSFKKLAKEEQNTDPGYQPFNEVKIQILSQINSLQIDTTANGWQKNRVLSFYRNFHKTVLEEIPLKWIKKILKSISSSIDDPSKEKDFDEAKVNATIKEGCLESKLLRSTEQLNDPPASEDRLKTVTNSACDYLLQKLELLIQTSPEQSKEAYLSQKNILLYELAARQDMDTKIRKYACVRSFHPDCDVESFINNPANKSTIANYLTLAWSNFKKSEKRKMNPLLEENPRSTWDSTLQGLITALVEKGGMDLGVDRVSTETTETSYLSIKQTGIRQNNKGTSPISSPLGILTTSKQESCYEYKGDKLCLNKDKLLQWLKIKVPIADVIPMYEAEFYADKRQDFILSLLLRNSACLKSTVDRAHWSEGNRWEGSPARQMEFRLGSDEYRISINNKEESYNPLGNILFQKKVTQNWNNQELDDDGFHHKLFDYLKTYQTLLTTLQTNNYVTTYKWTSYTEACTKELQEVLKKRLAVLASDLEIGSNVLEKQTPIGENDVSNHRKRSDDQPLIERANKYAELSAQVLNLSESYKRDQRGRMVSSRMNSIIGKESLLSQRGEGSNGTFGTPTSYKVLGSSPSNIYSVNEESPAYRNLFGDISPIAPSESNSPSVVVDSSSTTEIWGSNPLVPYRDELYFKKLVVGSGSQSSRNVEKDSRDVDPSKQSQFSSLRKIIPPDTPFVSTNIGLNNVATTTTPPQVLTSVQDNSKSANFSEQRQVFSPTLDGNSVPRNIGRGNTPPQLNSTPKVQDALVTSVVKDHRIIRCAASVPEAATVICAPRATANSGTQQTKEDALFIAVEKNNLEEVKHLVNDGADINFERDIQRDGGKTGKTTVLKQATMSGFYQIVGFLIKEHGGNYEGAIDAIYLANHRIRTNKDEIYKQTMRAIKGSLEELGDLDRVKGLLIKQQYDLATETKEILYETALENNPANASLYSDNSNADYSDMSESLSNINGTNYEDADESLVGVNFYQRAKGDRDNIVDDGSQFQSSRGKITIPAVEGMSGESKITQTDAAVMSLWLGRAKEGMWNKGAEVVPVEIDSSKINKSDAASEESPSTSAKETGAVKLVETTLYKPVHINESSTWHEKNSKSGRGNNLKVVNGVYGVEGDRSEKEAIENTLLDIICKVAIDNKLKFEDVLLIIKEAREQGGIKNVWMEDKNKYLPRSGSEKGAEFFKIAKKFSKEFQRECGACGILSGRDASSRGLRTTFIPETVLSKIPTGDVKLSEEAGKNLKTRKDARDLAVKESKHARE